jgi:hypothetical protein
MKASLIITSGSGKHFNQLKNFISSLRTHGKYTDEIALCDNSISGAWDKPGTWSEEESFSLDQKEFFKEMKVKIFLINQLITDNDIDPAIIRAIKSPTQRYPYKFIYNTLISKHYLNKVRNIYYFDSDIYFQAPFHAIEAETEDKTILIVKEFVKMEKSPYLNKWLKFSNFSKISDQNDYLKEMMPAANFCSGFYGSGATTFHRFNLLALLLTSNQFVNFYSDQPLVNILKTFFHYPFKEISSDYCLHLGELKNEEYNVLDGCFIYQGKKPISVHFNSGKYTELEAVLSGRPLNVPLKKSVTKRIADKLKREFHSLVNRKNI